MKFNYKTVIATTAFIALVSPLMASAAIKSSNFEHSEVTVDYSPVELSSEHGKARVENLIRVAARQVCGDVNPREAGSLRNATANKTCYNDAVEKAMDKIEGLSITSL
jgi:UrcA family protein